MTAGFPGTPGDMSSPPDASVTSSPPSLPLPVGSFLDLRPEGQVEGRRPDGQGGLWEAAHMALPQAREVPPGRGAPRTPAPPAAWHPECGPRPACLRGSFDLHLLSVRFPDRLSCPLDSGSGLTWSLHPL